MENNTNQEHNSYSGYSGYPPQQQPSYPYDSQEEMPRSSYPHEGLSSEDPYAQGQQQQYSNQQQYQQYQQQQYQQAYYTPPVEEVSPFERTSMGIKARTAGWLSYLFGWVSGLVILLLERDNRFARFHAMQSLLFFGGLSLLEGVFGYIPFDRPIRGILGLIGFICWIILINAARKGRFYKLPVIGDYAEKWADQIKVR
ncbi:MAG: hypothetical protein JOZ18_09155 [Chloroflexi bacterium]|nr:hypothetical protein [Chloroflexota bacterium]